MERFLRAATFQPSSPGVVIHAGTLRRSPERAQRIGDREPGVPAALPETLASPGHPLDAASRTFFEARFAHDFSGVRIHADNVAAEANRGIGSRAFAVGDHVAFGHGQYMPSTPTGRRLLAHELTHVVQDSGGTGTVRRDIIDDTKKALEQQAEELAKQQLGKLAAAPAGPASGFTNPGCPPNFCQPFADKKVAAADLLWAGPLILAGIARKVNPRVVPLWASYLAGGSGVKNLTADFGADFTASQTTAATTSFLVGELRKDVERNHATLLGGAATARIDFTPRLAAARSRIDDPAEVIPPQMKFDVISDIAGNITGGIGKDETSFPIGARPSPFNDSREATITASLSRNAGGGVTVTPMIRYTVRDTIDLCPGDCGDPQELVATVPLSRFEATGLSGDVPIVVEFDAPAATLAPFVVSTAPPAATTVPGVVAAALNIRSAPSTSAPIVGGYARHTTISVLCQTRGTVVDGNDVWFRTDKGFVSARYVTLTGSAPPASC